MKIKKIIQKDLVAFTILYFFSHWMLIVASGRWWDDWQFINMDAMKSLTIKMGRPEVWYILTFSHLLPQNGYRIISFFLILFTCYLFYYTLQTCNFIDREWYFPLLVFFGALPIYDIRIMEAVFPYTIGVFLFWLAFASLSRYMTSDDRRTVLLYRIASLLFFFCSFILNSNLFFYGLVILYIFHIERYKVTRMICYIDFVFNPILFFGLKNYFFPTTGEASEYNKVTILRLLQAAVYTIPASFYLFIRILMIIFAVGGILGFIIYLVFTNRDDIATQKMTEMSGYGNILRLKRVDILLVGFVALYAGCFPYVVVRQIPRLTPTGIGGRDAILSGLGISFILLWFIIQFGSKRIMYLTMIIVSVSSILHFNIYYASYQRNPFPLFMYIYYIGFF